MKKGNLPSLLSLSVLLVAVLFGNGEARKYQTWCKSFSTGENVACSTHTDYGGTYSYTPSVAPTVYQVPDNTLFNVRYEAPNHQKALFSLFVDSQVSTCRKGSDCGFTNGKWETRCAWNKVDSWVCTICHQGRVINQYYLLSDYVVRNYRYLAPTGNANSPPIITDVPPLSFKESSDTLANMVDLWFYAGDDHTPKSRLTYAVTNQSNPGVVNCSVTANRYISCSPQPSANGFSDITFSVKDAGGATTSSTFRITITPAGATAAAPEASTLRIPAPPVGDSPAPASAETPPETQAN